MNYNFENMYRQIQQMYPRLATGTVVHIGNVISNRLRKTHQDIYQVTLTKNPPDGIGNDLLFVVTLHCTVIYVQVVVD